MVLLPDPDLFFPPPEACAAPDLWLWLLWPDEAARPASWASADAVGTAPVIDGGAGAPEPAGPPDGFGP